MTLEEHSCLLENQSGLVVPAALDEGEVLESLVYRAMDLDLEQVSKRMVPLVETRRVLSLLY
jgi:hypothetical protein